MSAFAEPALLLCLTVLVLATGELSLAGMLGERLAAVWSGAAPSLVLTAAALFMLALAETSRVPVDDPATHLELTMIHEVIVLDHSGPELAMILFGNAVKLALFGALVVGVLVPLAQLPPWLAPVILVAGLGLVAVGGRRRRVQHGTAPHEPGAPVPRRGGGAGGIRRHPAPEVSDVRPA